MCACTSKVMVTSEMIFNRLIYQAFKGNSVKYLTLDISHLLMAHKTIKYPVYSILSCRVLMGNLNVMGGAEM